MTQERTDRPPFVMSKFPGYYRSAEKTSYDAPSGSLDDLSIGYLVSRTGKLEKAFGSAAVSTSGLTRPRQMFWWERSRGGGVAIAEGAAGLLTLAPGPPQGLWTALRGDSTITVSDQRDRIGRFTSYGDFAFYVNGFDRPKKIRRHDLKVYEMGLKPPESAEMPTTYQVVGNIVYSSQGLSFGVYEYRFTYVYAQGGESNGSDDVFRLEVPGDAYGTYSWGTTRSSANEKLRMFVYFDGFPTSTNYPRDDITHIRVYRRRAGSGSYFRVGEIPRGYRSFLDKYPDSFLGPAMPDDADLPPISRYIAIHDDRAWYGGSLEEGAGDLLRYSKRGQPDVVPSTYVIPQSEWANAGRMTGIKSLSGILYFTFERAVFRLDGTRPQDYELVPITESIGCIAPESLRAWGDALVYLSPIGPAMARGSQAQHLSNGFEFDLKQMNHQDIRFSCGSIVGDQYVICTPSHDRAAYQSASYSVTNMTRTFSVNLNNGGIGSLFDSFDTASDAGPYDYPMVCRFFATTGGGLNDTPRLLGYGYKRFGEATPRDMYLSFNWTDLDEPMEKTLDALEIDVACYSPEFLSVTVTDPYGGSITTTNFNNDDRVYPVPATMPRWDTAEWGAGEDYPEIQLFTLKIPTSDATTAHLTGRRFKLVVRETSSGAPVMFPQPVTIHQIRWYYDLIDRRG